MNKDQILSAAKWRSAIKEFDPERKISDSDFELLLEVARFSPRSFGFEPWNIIVAGTNLREALKPAIGSNIPRLEASHFLIFTVKTDLAADSKYFRHIMTDICKDSNEVQERVLASFQNFQNVSQDLTDDRKRHDWAAKQAYIVMANIMLAAAEIGIDSCPIEGFDLAKVEKILSDNNVVDLTTDRVSVMLALGYRAGEPPHTKTRRPFDEVVTYS
jgi:nitroreductase